MPSDLTHFATAARPAELHQALSGQGFVPHGRTYVSDVCTFSTRGRWHVLHERSRHVAPGESRSRIEPNRLRANTRTPWTALSRGIGEPGLWKWVKKSPDRVFEIPAWVISVDGEDDIDESGPASFDAVLRWALESLTGRPSTLSNASQRSMIESWFSRSALTVQGKGFVRQGELHIDEHRTTLRFPIVTELPGDFPAWRWRVLEQLVGEAQRHWAMARIGTTFEAGRTSLIAEVDFTGAPPCQLLFSAGLDVLRHVIAWLVETVEVLTDPSLELASLAPRGNKQTSLTNIRSAQ